MHAVVRVADSMNAQEVANTLWAFAKLKLQPGDASRCLVGAVPRVLSGNLEPRSVSQVRLGLDWLEEQGSDGAPMKLALQAVDAAVRRHRTAAKCK